MENQDASGLYNTMRTVKQQLRDSSKYCVRKGLYVSQCSISLPEACAAQSKICSSTHYNCNQCANLLDIAKFVLEKGIVKLSETYRQFFPGKKYVSNKVVRLLMGMPFVVVMIDQLYLMAKEEGVDYEKLHVSLQQFKPSHEDNTKNRLTKEKLKAICKLATSQKDSLLIKYAACAASCKSAKKAKSVYGFQDFHKKDQLIQKALEQAHEIKDAIESLVASEEAAMLESYGIYEGQDRSQDEVQNEVQDEEEVDWDSSLDDSDTSESELPEIESDGEEEILSIEQDFYRSKCTSTDHETFKELVLKKRNYIRRKAARKFLKERTRLCLLKRRIPTNVSSIVKRHPTIGKDVENFVSEKQLGADAWRRTGVITFDGNRKRGPKVTYKQIQHHLQELYGEHIAYGTVVQLCVIKNSRRLSAKRYKGVAKVTCRRARKGFSMKYNPDAHWNSALYRNLDYIQLQDGRNKNVLNRDDQAGFRLDTTFTHKQQKCIFTTNRPTLTTHTDFVNQYPSILQTTSYLLMETKTTPVSCIAVVKPHFVFNKNPAQHAADTKMLTNANLIEHRPIDCIRVDGASDEGPSHLEVQFNWTERHMQDGKIMTIVTTRHSGGSYLNRVELMNGCIARSHANAFIPSTITGSNFDENGLNEERLKENLNIACDVYMDRVKDSPCMGTKLKVVKGCEDEVANELQDRRANLLTFLKGTQQAKRQLQETNQAQYEYFSSVWAVRNRHMVKDLPDQYIFALLVCLQADCTHPACQRGTTITQWHPNGPPLSYIPLPIPDVDTWGTLDCDKCKENGKPQCHGHYMDPEKSLERWIEEGDVNHVREPPSQVIKDFVNPRSDEEVSISDMEELAKKLLLPTNEVEMYVKHLQHVRRRRKAGAKKAAETRRRRRQAELLPVEPPDDPDDIPMLDEQQQQDPLPSNPQENLPIIDQPPNDVQDAVCCWCQQLPSQDGRMIRCSNGDCVTKLFHYECLGLLHQPPDLEWLCSQCQVEDTVYCYCQQGEFGRMIKCDNSECYNEWFHYQCVGIKRKPRGSWKCPTCR